MVRVAEVLLFEQTGKKPCTKNAVPQAMTQVSTYAFSIMCQLFLNKSITSTKVMLHPISQSCFELPHGLFYLSTYLVNCWHLGPATKHPQAPTRKLMQILEHVGNFNRRKPIDTQSAHKKQLRP